ncbi:MAG TPA: hypothetical protein VFS43_17770 [Polyangiaceae bacterium]|nr:hypothetical protein [Polyangiaceae bacterium]
MRVLSLTGLAFASAALLAVACGDEDDDPGNVPRSGASGASGASGKGGSAGSAGGGQGAAGQGGAQGMSGAGGAGGQGGASGQAGAGGGLVVNQIAARYNHSCALVNGGQVLCWGDNVYGQLGDGTAIDRLTPVAVLASPGGPPLTGVQALALGYQHSCALLGGGEIRCWGLNNAGQLGDGTTIARSTPVPVVQSLMGDDYFCRPTTTISAGRPPS